MAEVLLFHHAQGLTTGVEDFADDLRRAGHVVHIPDLYDGNTFDSLDDGIAYAAKVGFGEVMERGCAPPTGSAELVYAASPRRCPRRIWRRPDRVPGGAVLPRLPAGGGVR